MSDPLKHECGLAFLRLRKPFGHFLQQYGSAMYGLNKLYLLMEKQHNRGQDGAGVATVKLDMPAGQPFLSRVRSAGNQPIATIFAKIGAQLNELQQYMPEIISHPGLLKGHIDFMGECLLGHLRYGTQGKNDESFCHPFVKREINPSLNIALAGNFNLVNTDELFDHIGITPGAFSKQSDLAAMLEVIHFYLTKADEKNPNEPDIAWLLKQALPLFDGGYTIGGLIGNGYSFVCRDANGIRPAYYYINDDVIVAASERAAIRTAFNVGENEVQELMPGHALIVHENGSYKIEKILPEAPRFACSFERIYFSRGSDEKIYRERIDLGKALSKYVLEAIGKDLRNTIFSYIPNTAEVAFFGLNKGLEEYLNQIKIERIQSWNGNFTTEQLTEMINRKIRMEKIAIKDVKMRTFISADTQRNEMVQHVYDTTYGTVRPHQDALVVIDDSIVRGTTLKESIIRMLAKLNPTKIIIVSSAPQIRYPDCYGIDMSKLGDFIAFKAAIALLKETGNEPLLHQLLTECKALKRNNQLHTINVVRKLYKPFTTQQITDKIAQLVTPDECPVPVQIIYQTIEDLHSCLPNNKGDWYFTGNYPTPGGNKVCNQAFMNYMDGKDVRGY
jgi:amidophosphoribosyltransferase